MWAKDDSFDGCSFITLMYCTLGNWKRDSNVIMMSQHMTKDTLVFYRTLAKRQRRRASSQRAVVLYSCRRAA
ncbi:hypothetical protein EYF80_009369 [Liparis tanakae]|uniref:Uncharacterized protein n=1 Tax=Liparis tanakae TaxID=230148 RepID=A0A4Z2IR05_9TELE|nr:hypothetical protein EYF80_009369 [Liparis tanakae]